VNGDHLAHDDERHQRHDDPADDHQPVFGVVPPQPGSRSGERSSVVGRRNAQGKRASPKGGYPSLAAPSGVDLASTRQNASAASRL
jgi:hypothetical protein